MSIACHPARQGNPEWKKHKAAGGQGLELHIKGYVGVPKATACFSDSLDGLRIQPATILIAKLYYSERVRRIHGEDSRGKGAQETLGANRPQAHRAWLMPPPSSADSAHRCGILCEKLTVWEPGLLQRQSHGHPPPGTYQSSRSKSPC